MSITYGSPIQNDIAALLGRSTYSSLTAAQKIAVDGSWSSGALTGGAAGRAANILVQWANAYTSTNLTFASIPDTWLAWFIHEAAVLGLPAFPNAQGNDIRLAAERAKRDALISYASEAFDSVTAGMVGALTIASIRAYAITNAIRAQDSVVLDPPLIDSAIEEVVSEIWNEADWSFKQVVAVLTIGTDGSVTVGSGLTLDKLLDDRILYTGGAGGFCALSDWQTILDSIAGTPSDGKPLLFHLTRTGDTLDWTFDRTPDQVYTAKGTFTIATPTMSNKATIETALGLFPSEFRPIIKNRVLAIALSHVGRVTVPAQLTAKTDMQIEGLLPRYDRTASQEENSAYEENRPYGMGASGGTIGGGYL